MFYERKVDQALRFGDVLRGYPSATPTIQEPLLSPTGHAYNIDVDLPSFSVVLSPCCSIGDKTISLAPLTGLRGTFFNNPYFVEDLTRINREMEPQQAVPPDVWDRFGMEERQRRLGEGKGYAFIELFVYAENEMLPRYTVHRKQGNIETGYYMIDFRSVYRLNCDSIVTPENSPLKSKCLQLSLQARSELRDKIASYFSRVPLEDSILED